MRTAFGGKVVGQNFGTSTTDEPRLNLVRIEEDLSHWHIRLAGVYIENLPYAEFIERYDRPHTLFYLDPPYFGCENDYGKGVFGREDFARLAALLKGIKGKFVLSINDTPEIRATFKGFRMRQVETTYTLSKKMSGRGRVRELLISNRALKGAKKG